MRLLVPCLLTLAAISSGDTPETSPRRKIGLALEGGSALGLAHVGVLEWLEENRIPIDYVAGTSMGGLIGGFYATGSTPADLRSILQSADWQRLLGGEIPFRDLSFRRKEDLTAFPTLISLGLRDGVSLPGGFNTGHYIGLLLSRMTIGYGDLKSFDDLPTPFRCVATNLGTGREEVFSKGSLADALRATMSLPGIFSPAIRDGKVMVDGGILQNLPVDIARQMGGDIVIAVHLAKAQVDPTKIRSLPSVIEQAISVVVSSNEMRTIQRADIVISVDLARFGITDYLKSAEIAAAGKQAAEDKAAILRTLALSPAEWDRHLAMRQARRRPNPPTVSGVIVESNDDRQVRLLEHTIKPLVENQLDPSEIEYELSRTAGAGSLASLRYSVVNGKLLIQTEAKSYGPPFLSPLVEIDGSDINNFRFSTGARITHTGFGSPRAEWRNDIILGSRYRVASEYWLPLYETRGWFVAPRAFAGDERFPIYDRGNQIADYRYRDAGAGIDLGYQFNRFTEFRIGHTFARITGVRKVGEPLFPNFSYKINVPGARFRYLGLDDPIVPRDGLRVDSTFGYLMPSNDSLDGGPQAELQMVYFRKTSKQGSTFTGAAGASSFSTRSLGLQSYALGGPLKLPAYATNELLGHQYWLGTAGYLHQLNETPILFGTRVYGAMWGQIGKVYGFRDESGVGASAAAAMVLRTFIGPVFIGGAYGNRGHRRVFIGVGRFF